MIVGISGLGLIGGSLAKALKAKENTVFAYDINKTVLGYAEMTHIVDEELSEQNVSQCDFIFVALYPKDTIEYITKISPFIKKGATVIDCCGVKKVVCEPCFALAEEYGFHFIGGHPMAGIQFSGYKHSREDMFKGANMILVPKRKEDINVLAKAREVLIAAGFASVTLTDADAHDRAIAFTSQLAHVVSNAYVKSPTARSHHGFSAGSYRDLTRVAKLNADMWTEIFLDNRGPLIDEIDCILKSLSEYRDAIAENDKDTLYELLRQGSEQKENIDAEWKE